MAPEKRDAAIRRLEAARFGPLLALADAAQLDRFIDAEVAQTPKGKAPSPQAWALADQQAKVQLVVAVADCNAMGLTSLRAGGAGREWPIKQPSSLNSNFARIGLPLLGSLAPTAGAYLSTLRSALALKKKKTGEPAFSAARSDLAACVADFLITERALWMPAEIPYAFRWAALTVLWLPAAHKAQKTPALCLRCGEIHQRQRDTGRVPLCKPCAKNDANSAHTWPTHAIAPAGQGTWWLRCQHPGCDYIFRAPRNASKCNEHKAALLTPARRHATAA